MDAYRVLITRDIFAASLSGRDKREILRFLERLASDPYQVGDYPEQDSVGRPVEVKIIGGYALTFWSDHGEREVKIIRIRKADR